LANRIRALCAHGIDSTTLKREKETRPWIRVASGFGYNFRMSNLSAAIGVEQMKKIESLNDRRRQLAELYLRQLQHIPSIQFQQVPKGYVHSWQMFTIVVPETIRDGLLHNLRNHGVEASVHFDPPIHEQSVYRNLKQGETLETAWRVAKSLITLPIFPDMESVEVDLICELIKKFKGLH
jgi:perosamine synthetase